MRNRFLKDYNSKAKTKSYIDKNYFKAYINNIDNPNFLASIKLKKLKSEIENTNQYIPKKFIKKDKCQSKDNLLKTMNKKSGLKIETNFYNNKHFIREFEDLFEKTTNNNITEYINGKDVEKMEDFVKGIKAFNYNDFIRKLKRKKNKKICNSNTYRTRNLSAGAYKPKKPKNLNTQPYNYKGSYSILSCVTSQNENNNSNIYLNTTCASSMANYGDDKKINSEKNNFNYNLNDYFLFNPLKRKLNINIDKYSRRSAKRLSQYKNEIERITMFNRKNIRNNSYNPKNNRSKIDNFIYHCKTKKNLNLI